jgi:hypothetical protein
MKRVILTAVAAAVLAAGCGGPTTSEPKNAAGKEDPRIKRANTGGAGKGAPAALKAPGGKGAQ